MLLKQLFSALCRTFGKGTAIDEDAFLFAKTRRSFIC